MALASGSKNAGTRTMRSNRAARGHGSEQDGAMRPGGIICATDYSKNAMGAARVAAAIAYDKEDHDRRNQQSEKNRHAGDVKIDSVHFAGKCRRALGNEWKC